MGFLGSVAMDAGARRRQAVGNHVLGVAVAVDAEAGAGPATFYPGFPRCLRPTTENGSTIEHRSKAWPLIPVWRLGLSRAAHPSPRQGAFWCEKPVIRQTPSARPPPVQPRSDDTRRHVGAGFGRRPSIIRRISANSRRGIATSASWNVTYRPWLTTLAPILISFPRGVVNDQCLTSSRNASVRTKLTML